MALPKADFSIFLFILVKSVISARDCFPLAFMLPFEHK